MSDAIRINLLPTREVRALRRRRREVMAGAAALLLVAGALAAGNFRQWRRADALERDLAALRQRVAAMRVEAKAVAALEGTVERERLRNRAVAAWLGSRNEHSRVLRGLSAAAPERLWLTRYGESPDATVLEGRSIDDESIARFLRGLSGTFEPRDLVEAGKAATGGVAGERLRRFVIHGRRGLPAKAAPPPASGPRVKPGVTKTWHRGNAARQSSTTTPSSGALPRHPQTTTPSSGSTPGHPSPPARHPGPPPGHPGLTPGRPDPPTRHPGLDPGPRRGGVGMSDR